LILRYGKITRPGAPIDLIYRPGPAKYPQIQAEILTPDSGRQLLLRGDVVDKYMRDILVTDGLR